MLDLTHRPPIVIKSVDHDRLLNLAWSAESPGAAALTEELTRATVVSPNEFPIIALAMNDRVDFVYDGAPYSDYRLVYPREADISLRSISVLTPVGAMLLGLSEGQTISWTGPDGRERSLSVQSVRRPGSRRNKAKSSPRAHVEA